MAVMPCEKDGYMLGTPNVKSRAISREVGSLKELDPSETIRRPSLWEDDIVRSAWRHAEVGRNDLSLFLEIRN